MNKTQLEKNCLDLEYQKNLQHLNALLSLGVGSIIVFLGGLILNFEKWFLYSVILILIFTIIILSRALSLPYSLSVNVSLI